MTLWEVNGFVAANIEEAYMLWCEFTIAGLWWSVFTTALISVLICTFVSDESINN
jgi:hypothetical protein